MVCVSWESRTSLPLVRDGGMWDGSVRCRNEVLVHWPHAPLPSSPHSRHSAAERGHEPLVPPTTTATGGSNNSSSLLLQCLCQGCKRPVPRRLRYLINNTYTFSSEYLRPFNLSPEKKNIILSIKRQLQFNNSDISHPQFYNQAKPANIFVSFFYYFLLNKKTGDSQRVLFLLQTTTTFRSPFKDFMRLLQINFFIYNLQS